MPYAVIMIEIWEYRGEYITVKCIIQCDTIIGNIE
jgi:hypothetical protein